jgi:lipopolysaccharide/colanic/teichoic acid biosynthesis glycosyltransferase
MCAEGPGGVRLPRADRPLGKVNTEGTAELAEVRSTSRQSRSPTPLRGSGQDLARRSAARTVKYAFDRVSSACGLIVTLPLLAAVALVLRLQEGGTVLRREERVGEDGRPIVVRSFAVTEAMCSRSRGWRLVRATGLTVLPQLWSVLRGDMSIIGPRARPRAADLEPPLVRPGLTGLAQLAQLERWLSVAEQLELDEEYARTWSLALDARIVWRTMWCVLR